VTLSGDGVGKQEKEGDMGKFHSFAGIEESWTSVGGSREGGGRCRALGFDWGDFFKGRGSVRRS